MVVAIQERGKSPVYIDRDGEVEIVERAFEGIEHVTLQTPDLGARTDFDVALTDLTHYVVEVKDRAYTYAYLAERGPLVDTRKVEAVIKKARASGAVGIIIWRSSDGFLIGAEATDILEYGSVDPTYKRLKGNRPQDREKPASVIPLEFCYVRPPATVRPGRLEREWVDWLAGSSHSSSREEN